MKNKIYIISLSPSLDYIVKFDNLKIGETNRPIETEIYAAGKGIHMSMLLNNIGVDNESIVFTNGEFESFFYNDLDKIGIKYKKFPSEGDIRINLKLIDDNQTECSAKSPMILEENIERLFNYLEKNVNPNDYVIAAGSVPQGVDSDIYARIVNKVNNLKAFCVIDAFGEALNNAIKERPFLIKPNKTELELTTGIKINSETDLIKAAEKLLHEGVKNVLISMGEEGAVFINETTKVKCEIGSWNKKLVNAAGAGDSMMAGFVAKWIETNDIEASLKNGIICGSATAFSNKIATHNLIKELESASTLKVEKL
ncbi:1-phosphofructokinase [Spiroplasma chinense]|uniref:1-phosphofructokinase n=1 Tax=Spiroplasma chinense TaxID=216932 RepID=A0A5B9Y3B9_9MOLU|nr:1-phosphofructokinase family hexose kinase [Spiroplasma chinense]QEH61481.1 1-phosphofructokinase [Spiroplasma chinense]